MCCSSSWCSEWGLVSAPSVVSSIAQPCQSSAHSSSHTFPSKMLSFVTCTCLPNNTGSSSLHFKDGKFSCMLLFVGPHAKNFGHWLAAFTSQSARLRNVFVSIRPLLSSVCASVSSTPAIPPVKQLVISVNQVLIHIQLYCSVLVAASYRSGKYMMATHTHRQAGRGSPEENMDGRGDSCCMYKLPDTAAT